MTRICEFCGRRFTQPNRVRDGRKLGGRLRKFCDANCRDAADRARKARRRAAKRRFTAEIPDIDFGKQKTLFPLTRRP